LSTRADLSTLEAGGLIEIAALQPELEYLFRHALVQEAAYSSLLKQDRRILHRAAAETILALHPDRERELAAVVAMHFEEGGVGPRAAEYLVLAGDHAQERFASHEALAFFGRALSLAEESQVEVRLRALIGQAAAGWAFGPSETLITQLGQILTGGGEVSDGLRAEAYFWVALLRRMRGETPESSPELTIALDRAKEIGGELEDQTAVAVPRALLGAYAALSGQLREGALEMRGALDVIERKGDAVSAAMVANFLSGAYSKLGDFAAAAEIIERSKRYAEKGDSIAVLDRDIALAGFHLERGEPEQACMSAGACSTRAEELGAFACVVASNVIGGAANLALNDALAAKGSLDRGYELCRVVNFAPMRTLTYALIGSARAQLGDEPGAVADWTDALASARAMNDRYGEAQTLWGRGRTQARKPDPDVPAALDDLDHAIAFFEAMEARPALARALLDRGSVLRQSGRSGEGASDELRARELARQLGLRDIASG
jgi:tetratricopeptide (TPR) repeat protein